MKHLTDGLECARDILAACDGGARWSKFHSSLKAKYSPAKIDRMVAWLIEYKLLYKPRKKGLYTQTREGERFLSALTALLKPGAAPKSTCQAKLDPLLSQPPGTS